MRNLTRICVASRQNVEALPLNAAAWNTSSDSLILVFGPSPGNPLISTKTIRPKNATSQEIASWDSPCPLAELDYDKVLNVHHLADIETLCLVLAGGDIVLVKERATPGEDRISIVGSVDFGLTAASWSPDGEILALITRENSLLLMTADFINVSSTKFELQDAKLSKHVSVGWGKKETQFKGKGVAKAMRDPTMPETTQTGSLSVFDEGQVTLAWRGDGSFLAVNSVESALRRMIRVFTRQGVLESVSEPVDGLEGALSWRPSGNLIGGVQRLENEANIVFFERNGLQHGKFSLRLKANDLTSWATHIDLQWNNDSSILAICFRDRVQLWMIGNYHYYLKQEISTGSHSPASDFARALWHPEDALRLAIYSKISQVHTRTSIYEEPSNTIRNSVYDIQLASIVENGPTAQPNDLGLVAVIDGCWLKVTPLRKANVPPPMALHEIKLNNNAIDAAVNPLNSSLAVLFEHSVMTCPYPPHDRAAVNENFQSVTFDLPKNTIPLQVCFKNEKDIVVLLVHDTEDSTTIFHVQSATSFSIPERAPSRLFQNLENNEICLEHGKKILRLHLTENGFIVCADKDKFSDIGSVLEYCPWINMTSHLSSDIVFALSVTGTLYANGQDLARNCTSFILTESHLIFTTTNHLLKFVNIDSVSKLVIPTDEPESDERCRSIERGGRLITVTPTSYSLILQMPRGNLETIYPRALVLAGVRKFINDKEYKKAFVVCRSHRVDMNILHDYAPEQFLHWVPLVIQQLDKVEYIDLFLSQLRDVDVCKTIYQDASFNPQETSITNEGREDGQPMGALLVRPTNKVNRVCDAFLNAFGHETQKDLQNSISAHVCKSPPDLDAGLSVIIKLRERDNKLTDAAVEHICFLADINQLYNHALGLYDLELSLLVAQKSQKDPREYLPYLQRLQDMELTQRQFTIDDDLAKHDKALRALYSLNDFAVFEQYMAKHQLYQLALELCRYDQKHERDILMSYATYLSSMNQFKDAAIAYDSIGDFASASEAYKSANLWKESLTSAALANMGSNEIFVLATSFSDALIESKDFYSAANIQLEYLSNVEVATKLFCKGYYFIEALRIIGRYERSDLLPTAFDSSLIESSGVMTELLADCRAQIQAQVPRLRELRLKKTDDPLAFYDGIDDPNIPDNISLAPTNDSTTGGTFFTRYTNRSDSIGSNATRKTSKNRRREERKRARGKKGSVYEEEYIVNSIGRLIDRVNSVNDEVGRLVEGLLKRSMRGRAAAVELAMDELISKCQECLEEVFEVAESDPDHREPEERGDRPEGADKVHWESVEAQKQRKKAPTLLHFKRSPLLGC